MFHGKNLQHSTLNFLHLRIATAVCGTNDRFKLYILSISIFSYIYCLLFYLYFTSAHGFVSSLLFSLRDQQSLFFIWCLFSWRWSGSDRIFFRTCRCRDLLRIFWSVLTYLPVFKKRSMVLRFEFCYFLSLKAQCLADTFSTHKHSSWSLSKASGCDGTLSGHWNCGCLRLLRTSLPGSFGRFFFLRMSLRCLISICICGSREHSMKQNRLLRSLACTGALQRLNALSLTDPLTHSPRSWINQQAELALQEHVFISWRRTETLLLRSKPLGCDCEEKGSSELISMQDDASSVKLSGFGSSWRRATGGDVCVYIHAMSL